MPRLRALNSETLKQLDDLIALESKFQQTHLNDFNALGISVEYIFLSSYKVWENFVENIFISYCRYNEKIGRKNPNPYISPNTENKAREILKLDRRFIDWTSPDDVIQRAEILFKNHEIITRPIKSSIQDLRDAKKLRNHIAHGSVETKIQFDSIARQRISSAVNSPGEFLLANPRGKTQHYAMYYLSLFKSLVALLT